jgi:ABC-type lipoprotein export system ATPase subunit
MTATPVVEISDGSKNYRRGPEVVNALQDVNLSLVSGEVVALVGPSGSGKTTLLNVLAGWEQLDGGTLRWMGREGATPAALQWDDLAILPQSVGLVEELSVRENVALPGRFSGPIDPARIDRLLESLGLDKYGDRAPFEISIGEQQRTGLARALVAKPRLLLADEPSGHQDAGWAEGVYKAIRAAAAEGTACLVATHNRELLQFADRIVGILDGRLERVEHAAAHEHAAFRRRRIHDDSDDEPGAPGDETREVWGPGA